MSRSPRFKRKILALFFIVSLVPALVVAAIWYLSTQLALANLLSLPDSGLILPVFLLGIVPAALLSFAFAELLGRPVQRIHKMAADLAAGRYHASKQPLPNGEFNDIATALAAVSSRLENVVSESQSETELIAAERNKLRGVLNSMTDGVFALDRDGRIILFNKAASELTGRDIGEVAGQLAEKVMPFRSGGELVMTRWLATHKGSDNKVGQWHGLELYHANGSSLYVNVQAVVLTDDPNGINALVTFHDLTRDHQLEEMKIDFVALAAHELRTPLTELKGYLDILQHEVKGINRESRVWIDRSFASASELAGLVNNLLSVARIEHGEINYQFETVDYKGFLTELMPSYDVMLAEHKLSLQLNMPDAPLRVSADPISIKEVINNLVVNAISHTPPGGHILITVTANRHDIQTVIIDNGSGIPSDALGHLFTKFYRVSEFKATTRGTGLGLYISKSIIDAHQGTIWAESVEGKGSTFGFDLPRQTIAPVSRRPHNKTNITRGTHGWIKGNTARRG